MIFWGDGSALPSLQIANCLLASAKLSRLRKCEFDPGAESVFEWTSKFISKYSVTVLVWSYLLLSLCSSADGQGRTKVTTMSVSYDYGIEGIQFGYFLDDSLGYFTENPSRIAKLQVLRCLSNQLSRTQSLYLDLLFNGNYPSAFFADKFSFLVGIFK